MRGVCWGRRGGAGSWGPARHGALHLLPAGTSRGVPQRCDVSSPQGKGRWRRSACWASCLPPLSSWPLTTQPSNPEPTEPCGQGQEAHFSDGKTEACGGPGLPRLQQVRGRAVQAQLPLPQLWQGLRTDPQGRGSRAQSPSFLLCAPSSLHLCPVPRPDSQSQSRARARALRGCGLAGLVSCSCRDPPAVQDTLPSRASPAGAREGPGRRGGGRCAPPGPVGALSVLGSRGVPSSHCMDGPSRASSRQGRPRGAGVSVRCLRGAWAAF